MNIDKEGIDKECLNEAIKDYLKENLTLTVDTSEDYVGDMGGGNSLYKTSHVLHLWLGRDIISSVYLD